MIWLALACENIDGAVLSPLRRGILDGKFSVVVHADAGAARKQADLLEVDRIAPPPEGLFRAYLDEFEALLASASPGSTALLVAAAGKARKPVLIVKTGDPNTVVHAEPMVEAGAGLETLVKVANLQRYTPAPRAAGEQLKEGSLGEPALCNIHRWYRGRSDTSGSKGSSGGDAIHPSLSEKDHD